MKDFVQIDSIICDTKNGGVLYVVNAEGYF
jgi:hypothetical protein